MQGVAYSDRVSAPLLSVVTPAFNEAKTIHEALGVLVAHLDSLGIDYEVIVVSDGSTDLTYEQAGLSRHPRIPVSFPS